MYQPAAARWKSEDPLPETDATILLGSVKHLSDLNKYQYVRNNPVNLVDPSGLSPIDERAFPFGGGGSTAGTSGLLPGQCIDCLTGKVYWCIPGLNPDPCPIPSWRSGGKWKTSGSKISKIRILGEWFAPPGEGLWEGSIPIAFLRARWFATYTITTTLTLEGTICCPGKKGEPPHYVDVKAKITLTLHITHQFSTRIVRLLWVLLPSWWQFVGGYIVPLIQGAWSLRQKKAALNEATRDLTKMYQVIDKQFDGDGVETDVSVAIAPSIVCNLGLDKIRLSAEGIERDISIGVTRPLPERPASNYYWGGTFSFDGWDGLVVD